jgi:hypothetical protein
MISPLNFFETLQDIQQSFNNVTEDLSISEVKVAVSEAHMIKKISNISGIFICAKLPPATSSITSADNYFEDNHCLLFVLEKREPASVTDTDELEHYEKLQGVMRYVKDYFLNHGLTIGDNDETLNKDFRTEYEYQIFGNFNGFSVSFNMKDFNL